LDKYRAEIIKSLNQNLLKKVIFENIKAMGYTGKITALKDYCKKLIDELRIEYTPRKNAVGVAIKPKQKLETHYISRQEILKHLWSGEKAP